ncbi:hypothetical protein RRG08_021865 [Elysia crispata]|uniref:Uncharacterized protein n=1 Tax=Elysia crispata TaxID=231223 RepID=A0AAE0XEZ8_9GAST|nr:hypothetical protein RRG08_021865 [Elysia crispata]
MMILKVYVFGILLVISSAYKEILDDCDLTIDRCREMFIQQVPQNPAEDSLCSALRQYAYCMHVGCSDFEEPKNLIKPAILEFATGTYGYDCDLDSGQGSPRVVVMSGSFLLIALVIVGNFVFKF